jgi:hypothetical protein
MKKAINQYEECSRQSRIGNIMCLIKVYSIGERHMPNQLVKTLH